MGVERPYFVAKNIFM